MTYIHQSSIVHPKAKIGENVEIGPFCTVGENVEIADGVKLFSHVCLDGITSIGEGTKIYPFAAIGLEPQDLKYDGEKSKLIIGKNNRIREYVTIHPGTSGDKMETRVGDNCLIMVSAHIAHDCVVGNNVILANNATLAGHVHVGDFAIIGGLSAVHQFVRIGSHAIIGGMSGIEQDIIPYGSAIGERASLAGLNLVGLKRRNFDKDTINTLRDAYKILFLNDDEVIDKRIAEVEKKFHNQPYIMEVVNFMKAETSRAISFPKSKRTI